LLLKERLYVTSNAQAALKIAGGEMDVSAAGFRRW
jgi:hypothetical protein